MDNPKTIPNISPQDCAFHILYSLRGCGRNSYKFTFGRMFTVTLHNILEHLGVSPSNPRHIDDEWKQQVQTELVNALRELKL